MIRSLRLENAAHFAYDLHHVKRFVYKREHAKFELIPVEHVVYKCLRQSQLAHHEFAVLKGLGHLMQGERTGFEDLDDELEEEGR